MTSDRIADVLGHDYDHYDPAFALDPHTTYAELRARCPVGRSESYGGFHVLAKYDDIDHVLHHPEIFSSFPADTPPSPSHKHPLPPFETDPPDHHHYRRIVDPLFGPKRINTLEPALRSSAQALVENMLDKREFDFQIEFAQPFPSSAFLSLIGIEADSGRRDQLYAWVEQILHTTGSSGGDSASRNRVRVEAAQALRSFLSDVLDNNKDDPDTIFRALLLARFAGERELTRSEVLDFSYLLVLAGIDTVTSALGFSFFHLARRPDLQDELASDPSKIPAAVEEFLRYDSAVHPSRTVTAPCSFRQVSLQPGDRIVLPYASADRDEEIFERPDELILDRTPNRHFAFGGGSHRCLGSHLARLEMRIALEEILSRIPEFSLPAGAEIAAFGGQTRSLVNLPFRTWR